MGGHGGLNILPQKRWNVYNYDNREKVRRDEEAAAKEEQQKQEQARKRDAEFRLERLRSNRGLDRRSDMDLATGPKSDTGPGKHINLFDGIRILDPIQVADDGERKRFRKQESKESNIATKEDEKYRLGYGIAGKGVSLPWYVQKYSNNDGQVEEPEKESEKIEVTIDQTTKKKKKKSLGELREERLERENREKRRALLVVKSHKNGDRNKMQHQHHQQFEHRSESGARQG